MKYVAYLFMFVLMIASVSAVCYNQNDLPFCSKDDPTCQQVGDSDGDGDGWSDSCDAFPENKYFWVDYDGDNIGWGSQVYDCDDVDESITTLCGNTNLLTQDDESSDDSQSTSSSTNTSTNEETSSSSRSHRVKNTIYVSNPNDNFIVQQPVTDSKDEEPVEDTYPQTEIVPLDDPIPVDEIKETNQITGAVIGTQESFVVWPFFLLLVAILIMFFIAARKKKKDQ